MGLIIDICFLNWIWTVGFCRLRVFSLWGSQPFPKRLNCLEVRGCREVSTPSVQDESAVMLLLWGPNYTQLKIWLPHWTAESCASLSHYARGEAVSFIEVIPPAFMIYLCCHTEELVLWDGSSIYAWQHRWKGGQTQQSLLSWGCASTINGKKWLNAPLVHNNNGYSMCQRIKNKGSWSVDWSIHCISFWSSVRNL